MGARRGRYSCTEEEELAGRICEGHVSHLNRHNVHPLCTGGSSSQADLIVWLRRRGRTCEQVTELSLVHAGSCYFTF